MYRTISISLFADLFMKKRIVSALIVSAISFGIMFQAKAESEVEFIPMQATSYCINGTTATGTHTRIGICAGPPEHYGDTAMVYKRNKDGSLAEFIGYFECEDTGSAPIRNGKVLDIWLPTYEECRQFGNPKIYVVWVHGVG